MWSPCDHFWFLNDYRKYQQEGLHFGSFVISFCLIMSSRNNLCIFGDQCRIEDHTPLSLEDLSGSSQSCYKKCMTHSIPRENIPRRISKIKSSRKSLSEVFEGLSVLQYNLEAKNTISAEN